MLANLATVCRQSAVISQIAHQVDSEIRLIQEKTKHACKNCIYFSGSEYLMCAVHPEGAGLNERQVNECLDWELIRREES